MGLLVGIVANVMGGATYALQKVALDTGWTPALLVAARLLLSLPLCVALVPRGWRARATSADGWRMALVGVLGFAAPHLVGSYGLVDSDSSSGAILIGMEPVAIAILAHFFLAETISRRQLAGIALALVGAVLVVSKGDPRGLWAPGASIRGTALLAIHGALWSIYTVGAKPTLDRVPASAFTSVTTAIALIVVAPFALAELPSLDRERALAPVPLACVITLGVGVSWLGTLLWNYALARISATMMASLIFLQPLTGVLLGAALGEPLLAASLFGGALVLAGVWLGESRAVPRVEDRGAL